MKSSTSERARRRIAAGLVFTVLTGACTTTAEPVVWTEAASYTYELDSFCGERDLIGSFEITVGDRVVTEAKPLDDSAETMLRLSGLDHVPTLADLVEELISARQAKADMADIAYDPTDGHPVTIDIDWDVNATDDESCYVIRKYHIVK